MARFTFGTFIADEANRAAFEACQDVASRNRKGSTPLIILGDEGCGKTHLLYSIVNRIKSSSDRTGIAYITAYDFPLEVRALIEDPSPVSRAKSAVLLVDHLDDFDDLFDDLERVAAIFLEHGHQVVMASKAHPGRLHKFPPGLSTLFEEAEIIAIAPDSTAGAADVLTSKIKKESEALIEKQRHEIQTQLTEIEQLRNQLQTSPPDHAPSIRMIQDHGNLDTDRRQDYEGTVESLHRQLEEAEDEKRSMTDELERLTAETSLMSVASKEAPNLRMRLKNVEEKYENARAEIELLRSTGDHATNDIELSLLRRNLEEAREEGAIARQQANDLLERAEALVEEVESTQRKFAQAQEDHEHHIRELQATLGDQGISPEAIQEAMAKAQEALTQLEERQHELNSLESTHQEVAAKLHEVEDKTNRVVEERDMAIAEVRELIAERDALLRRIEDESDGQGELLQKFRELSEGHKRLIGEVEDAENRSTSQIEAYQERIELLERALAAREREGAVGLSGQDEAQKEVAFIQKTYAAVHQASREVEAELKALTDQFANAVSLLSSISGQLAAEPQARPQQENPLHENTERLISPAFQPLEKDEDPSDGDDPYRSTLHHVEQLTGSGGSMLEDLETYPLSSDVDRGEDEVKPSA